MKKKEAAGEPFVWLCATNAGAAEVCRAALRTHGISDEELEKGYLPDPASKSNLRILARPGLLIRLTRNCEKQRGFVNGAVGIIKEALYQNSIFIVELIVSKVLVLVSPIVEEKAVFLPCTYGWATTIRRAQGSTLTLGCVYFNQKFFAAGRGYGYVAVSRFRKRSGVYLFGKLRRTDFLPVKEESPDEVLVRGEYSMSDNDSDLDDEVMDGMDDIGDANMIVEDEPSLYVGCALDDF